VGGAAGEPPLEQVPGCGALHRCGDTLSDTLHKHFTFPLHSLSFCVCSGARVDGAAGEPPLEQVPGRGALHRGGDTLSDTLHRHLTLHPSQPFILCIFRNMSGWCSR
jgi:hypothetical protein